MPQSPRFLILHGKADKALSVLNLMARINCKPKLYGHLVTVEEKERMQQEGELPDSDTQGAADGGQADGGLADGKDAEPQAPPSAPLLPGSGASKVGDRACTLYSVSMRQDVTFDVVR